MTIVAVVALAAAACAISLLTADRRSISLGTGLAGLALVCLACAVLDTGPVTLAGVVLVPGPFLRLVLLFGAACGVALTLVGLASGWAGLLPAATLGMLAALGIGLSATDPLVAVAAAGAAGLPGILVALRGPGRGDAYVTAAAHARTVIVALALATLAAAVVGRQAGNVADAGLTAAYLGVSLAVAVRLGSIPFHLPTARLARSSPAISLPLLLAWAPAGLAAAAFAWTDALVAPLALPLGLERGLVVAVGAVTLLAAPVAAWLAEDIERVVGYLTIQSAAYLVLGMAALDPAAWQPVRSWLLVYLLVTTALAAWAVAVRAAFGTGRIEALDGWARRAPLLGAALLATVLATVGWPGSPALDARLTLTRLAVGSGVPAAVLVLAGFASLAAFGRLALRGLAGPGPAVVGGTDERLRRPAVGTALRVGTILQRAGAGRDLVREAWRLDRAVVAAVLVALLAAGSLLASAGGLGVTAAASAPGPAVPASDVGPSPPTVEP